MRHRHVDWFPWRWGGVVVALCGCRGWFFWGGEGAVFIGSWEAVAVSGGGEGSWDRKWFRWSDGDGVVCLGCVVVCMS